MTSTRNCCCSAIRTMEEALARSLAERALYSSLLAVFAGLACVLALGGSDGVTAYLVSQRSRELGIRVPLRALGRHRPHDSGRQRCRRGHGNNWVWRLPSTRASGSNVCYSGSRHATRECCSSTALLLFVLAVAVNWWLARRAARADPLRACAE